MSAQFVLRRLFVALSHHAYLHSEEKQLHAAIGEALTSEGITFEREKTVGKNRYDFFVDGVVIEVKIDGSPADSLRRSQRYLKDEGVSALLLVTTQRWAKNARTDLVVCDKPMKILQIKRAFL